MSQLAVPVTTLGSGLIFLDPKPSFQHRHGVRLTNGVAEVLPNQRFDVITANVSRKPRRLPRNTIVGYAKRCPIAILTPEREVAEEIGRVMNITTVPDESTAPTGNAANGTTSSKGPVPKPAETGDWEEAVDLSHIEDPDLRTEILTMLRKHSSMWNGSLSTIRATEHRIDLERGTKPIRSMSYRQGPAMGKLVATEVKKMVDAGVIEPTTSGWASPVVLVLKTDGSLRFCVD